MSFRLSSGRLAAAGIAAAAVAVVAVPGASAHIGGAGNGAALTTDGPDLRSVSVVTGYDVNSSLPVRARYCFDTNVTPVANQLNGYSIFGYDANRFFKPTAINAATDDQKCVIASFAPGSDIDQGTVGSVDAGVVQDVQNKTNYFADEPLGGSVVTARAGASTGPDLLNATIDATDQNNKTVTYTYDEPLAPRRSDVDGNGTVQKSNYRGSDFGFVDTAGNTETSDDTSPSVSGSSITVNFGGAAGLTDTKRLVSAYDAVQDRPETDATAGLNPWTSSPFGVKKLGSTTRPDLMSAVAEGSQRFALTYNKAISVNANTQSRIQALTDDGFAATGQAATSATVRDGNVLVVTFPASVAADPNSVVAVSDTGNAVTDPSDTTNSSIASVASTSTPNSTPGFTAGPDLLGVAVDAADRQVTYRYDEPVDPDSATPGNFRAVNSDGSATVATGGLTVSGNSVSVVFGSDADNAVGYANSFGAIMDPTGRVNPAQSVSRTNEAAATPPGGGGGTSTTPGTTPPGTTPPGTTPPGTTASGRVKASTTISIKIKGGKYTGKLTSSQKTCSYKRVIVLKRVVGKKSKTIRRARTRKDGTFSIKRTSSTRGKSKVYVVASEKLTSTVNCTAKGSTKKKG